MRKLLFPILLIIIFIVLLIFARSPSENAASPEVTKKTTSTKKDEDFIVSPDKVYFQSITPEPGVPEKTTSDDAFPGLSIFWVQPSATFGQDTCTLYDNETKQIYGSRYLGSNTIGDPTRGTAYYTNDSIKQDKAVGLLDKLCFKP